MIAKLAVGGLSRLAASVNHLHFHYTKKYQMKTRKLTGLFAFCMKLRLLAEYFPLITVTEVYNDVGKMSIEARIPTRCNCECEMEIPGLQATLEGEISSTDTDLLDLDIKSRLKPSDYY